MPHCQLAQLQPAEGGVKGKKGELRVRGWQEARQVLLPGCLPTVLRYFSQKRKKDGSKELGKGATCWENGKEKAASAELAPEEPRTESTELPRSRREPSNPKRAQGRSETLGGKSPASPGTQSGPSAKRAVYLKVAPAEEEPNARVTGSVEPSKGHGGRSGSRRNGRASQGDAPTALTDLAPPLEKVRRDGVLLKRWHGGSSYLFFTVILS